MPPASTSGPSYSARSARTKASGFSQPVWPPAPAVSSTRPSAPAARALRAWASVATSASTRQPMSCRAATAGAGEPTLVMTSSTRCRTRQARSSAMRGDRMIRLGQTGAASSGAANSRRCISPSHWSSSAVLRALTVGKAPITPLRQAATTRSTPETLNIGAATSGRRSRRVMRSGRRGACMVVRALGQSTLGCGRRRQQSSDATNARWRRGRR